MTHTPVMVKEVLDIFRPRSGDRLLDCTLGLGGHAKAYLEATSPDGKVVGLETDPKTLASAKENLKEYSPRVAFLSANFSQLKDSLTGGGILTEFSHVLFDLGIGSHQLADQQRGFSFASEQSLSMRFNREAEVANSIIPAIDRLQRRLGFSPDVPELLRYLTQVELAEIIFRFGEERYARRIAQTIKTAPALSSTAAQLAQLIREAFPRGYERGRIHPATRTFQALRLAVNRELESLQLALPQAIDVLKPGGVVAVISFHSLEDRIVKDFFRQGARSCICPPQQPECICSRQPKLRLLTKKPLQASAEEKIQNPRSRSAKLRAAVKENGP